MNANPAIQNVATLQWDGTGVPHAGADIRKFNRFGWSFEVVAAIAVDVVFVVQAAPVSALDNCLPGAFANVDAIATCAGENIVAGTDATITIKAGTPIGTICSGTIPCRGGAFVRLDDVSGTQASIRAVLVRQGPQI